MAIVRGLGLRAAAALRGPALIPFRALSTEVATAPKSHAALSPDQRRDLIRKRPKSGVGGSVEEYHAIERDIRALHEDVKMYMDQADVVNALTAATECSRVTAAHLGKDHVAFASSLNNIALVHKESGNTTQALNYYEEALRVYRATAGDEHPSTVSVIANLGLLYTRMAEGTRGLERQAILDTAQEYMEQALESRKEILFPGAPIVSVTKSHLANIRRLQKRLPAALELHEEALRGLADKPGKEHRAYGDALNGYAVALKDAGRFDEAEAAYREALALRLAATHETHPDVLVTEFNLAECLLAKGDTQAALDIQKAMLERVGVEEDELSAGAYEGAELPGGLVIKGGALSSGEGGASLQGQRALTPEEVASARAAAALGSEEHSAAGASPSPAAAPEGDPQAPVRRTRSGKVIPDTPDPPTQASGGGW